MGYDIRDHIDAMIRELGLTKDDLKEVPKNRWQSIQHTFEETFVRKPSHHTRIYLYWDFLKSGYSISFDYDAHLHLHHFVHPQERVWFLAEEKCQRPKFWIYEGKAGAVQKVLAKGGTWYEYYLVSKKYEWLLCENHHGYLIGSGEKMIEKMIRYRKIYLNS
jgi:hypothetical protein